MPEDKKKIDIGFVVEYAAKNKPKPGKGQVKWGASFHWYGKDRRGVTQWGGGWDNLPKWFGLGFLIYAVCAGIGGLGLLAAMLLFSLSAKVWTGIMVLLIHSVVFGGIGWWANRMHRKIAALTPVDDVCATLGIDQATLEQIAADREIKPVYNINDRDFYDMADFDPKVILLRASDAPVEPDVLLRPAEPTVPNDNANLLRASEAAPGTETSHDAYSVEAAAPQQQRLRQG